MAPPSACRTGSFRRSRERGGTSHPRPPVRSPRPLGEGQGEGSGGRQCNQMQLNATELKVSPLLATPDEATAIGSRATPAHRVRVNGVPNEATVVSFSASQLGVNEANQGQMGPRFSPPSFPRRRHDSLALWERVRVRVRRRGMSGNKKLSSTAQCEHSQQQRKRDNYQRNDDDNDDRAQTQDGVNRMREPFQQLRVRRL